MDERTKGQDSQKENETNLNRLVITVCYAVCFWLMGFVFTALIFRLVHFVIVFQRPFVLSSVVLS